MFLQFSMSVLLKLPLFHLDKFHFLISGWGYARIKLLFFWYARFGLLGRQHIQIRLHSKSICTQPNNLPTTVHECSTGIVRYSNIRQIWSKAQTSTGKQLYHPVVNAFVAAYSAQQLPLTHHWGLRPGCNYT